jgi:hypothetical protein
MAIATETFLLYDYFLFYSPKLLAATAVSICMDVTNKRFRGIPENPTKSEQFKSLLQIETPQVLSRFTTLLGPDTHLDPEDIQMISADMVYRKELRVALAKS